MKNETVSLRQVDNYLDTTNLLGVKEKNPKGKYMFKVNNIDTIAKYMEVVLVLLLQTLNRYLSKGRILTSLLVESFSMFTRNKQE